jgi:hypothetical protein
MFTPKPVWAIGFALEQPLHVVALPCSASGISKQLEYSEFPQKTIFFTASLVEFVSYVIYVPFVSLKTLGKKTREIPF